VSLSDFSLVKKLGEGGFGKVLLATGSLQGRPEQLYAIKVVNKTRTISSNIFAEKEALMRTSLHPFVTTLYSCFQNKVFINFWNLYMLPGYHSY
jgi:serine/threonine protein kinase